MFWSAAGELGRRREHDLIAKPLQRLHVAENGDRTRVAIGSRNPVIDHQRTSMVLGALVAAALRARRRRSPPALQKLLIIVAFGALAVVLGKLLQQNFDLLAQKIDFCCVMS